jgi:hypothetical protein
MPELQRVMNGLAVQVAKTGLRVADHVPGKINPPQGVVTVPPIEYDIDFAHSRGVLMVTLTVLVSATLDQQGQHNLAAYADVSGDKSIKAIIDANRNLGGLVDDCRVSKFRPLGLTEVGHLGYFGGEFTIPISIRGVQP